MAVSDDADRFAERHRDRFYRDDAVRWVWIFYGLAQAVVTMLLAFDVIESTVSAAVVTAVALIVYVGVNEIFVRPYRSRLDRIPDGTRRRPDGTPTMAPEAPVRPQEPSETPSPL